MNKLEIAFDNGCEKYNLEDYYFIYNQPDTPPAFSSKKIRFKPTQLPDRLLLSKIHHNYLIELKQTKGSRFDFHRIPLHQIRSLLDFERKAGTSYILFSFNEFEKIVLVHITHFLKLQRIVKKEAYNGERRGKGKSFNVNDLEKIKYKSLKATLLRKNYELELGFLLPNQMVISSFI